MRPTLPLAILFSIFTTKISAQISKQQHYIGGNLNFNYNSAGTTSIYNYDSGYTTYTNHDITSIQISPELGYFISNKWAVGIQPSYVRTSGTEVSAYTSYTATSGNYTYTRKYHSDFAGLYINLRYYYMITDKVGIFPQFGISTANNINDLKSGTLAIGGSPNIVFFPSPKLGITLGFGNLSYSTDYYFDKSYFNLSINNNITLGLNYYWASRKVRKLEKT